MVRGDVYTFYTYALSHRFLAARGRPGGLGLEEELLYMDLTWTSLHQEAELIEVGQWSALIRSQRDRSVHPPAATRTAKSMTGTPITILKVDVVISASPTGIPLPVMP